MLKLIGLLSSLCILTSCYYENIDDRFNSPGNAGGNLVEKKDGDCEVSYTTGCFSGQIVSGHSISVDGRWFHNAEELASNFSSLLEIVSKESDIEGEQLVEGDSYRIELVEPFSATDFANGFNVFIRGGIAPDRIIKRNHTFFLNRLEEGEYQVRIEKPVKFKIITEEVVESIGLDGEVLEEETEVSQLYCASLFADHFVDIELGNRTHFEFDEFDLHLSNKECKDNSGINTKIEI